MIQLYPIITDAEINHMLIYMALLSVDANRVQIESNSRYTGMKMSDFPRAFGVNPATENIVVLLE